MSKQLLPLPEELEYLVFSYVDLYKLERFFIQVELEAMAWQAEYIDTRNITKGILLLLRLRQPILKDVKIITHL